jgi:DNA N-6-adenine-methyltransferase (Dam)
MIAFARTDNLIAFPPTATIQKSNEWYTPSKYVEAAREVMGGIDLDPASCAEANMVVKASKFYTKHDNGLEQPWYGNVWLNPPFERMNASHYGVGGGGFLTSGGGKSKMSFFVNKLIREYQAGMIQQAVLLTMPKTEAQWFRPLWDYPISFPDHRVLFNRPKGLERGQMFGTIFVYLGSNEQKFIDIFSTFGTIAKRVSTPRQTVTPLSLWEDMK